MRRSETGASVGVKYDVGGQQSGLSVEASAEHQSQNQVSDQATAVDTTLNASNSATLQAHDSTRLRGAEIHAPRIDVKTGQLDITSLQNSSDFKSVTNAMSGGIAIPIPGMGAGTVSGNASFQHQVLTDHYASTGNVLSGLYAGNQGIGVDVAGNTDLTAGVISSTADKAKNHITTGSLTSRNLENISRWKLESQGFQGGFGASGQGDKGSWLGQVGQGMAANSMSMLGGGRSYHKGSTSRSAIGDNITINTTSQSGDLIRDPTHANAALTNRFDAQKLQNQMQAQSLGNQLVGQVVGTAFEATQPRDKDGNPVDTGPFSPRELARDLIEAGGAAGIAAATGGNIGAAGVGTLAGNITAASTRALAGDAATAITGRNDGNLHDSFANLLSSAAASMGGAVGGLIGGGGGNISVDALSGAAAAGAIEQYNAQNHQKKHIETGVEYGKASEWVEKDGEYSVKQYKNIKINPENFKSETDMIADYLFSSSGITDDDMMKAAFDYNNTNYVYVAPDIEDNAKSILSSMKNPPVVTDDDIKKVMFDRMKDDIFNNPEFIKNITIQSINEFEEHVRKIHSNIFFVASSCGPESNCKDIHTEYSGRPVIGNDGKPVSDNNGNIETASSSITGAFQMRSDNFKRFLDAARKADPSLNTYLIIQAGDYYDKKYGHPADIQSIMFPNRERTFYSDLGQHDVFLEGIAAAAMGVYEAKTLIRAYKIKEPTVLEARALYVFGGNGGRELAKALSRKDDSRPMISVIGRDAMERNNIPMDTTVGEWRAHMSIGPSGMGQAVAGHIIQMAK